jgi:mRNA-degrading endonuclease RelE of RelBE toxin-antitoxin system
MWEYNETGEFVRSAEEAGLSADTREALKRWAPSINRTPTNRSRVLHHSEKHTFELWIVRIANPDMNRGASGGYRLIYHLDLGKKKIYLGRISIRSDRGGKNEHPKEQQQETEYIEELKRELKKQFDG